MQVEFKFSNQALDRMEAEGAHSLEFKIPEGSIMPNRGDLLTLPAGMNQITLRVLSRRFEYLPNHVHLLLVLGLPEESLH